MGDLELVAELRSALANEDDPQTCWGWVTRLESSLDFNPNQTTHERDLMRRLRSQVSDMIAAKKNGLNVHASAARVTLSALETSIKKRTTGR